MVTWFKFDVQIIIGYGKLDVEPKKSEGTRGAGFVRKQEKRDCISNSVFEYEFQRDCCWEQHHDSFDRVS